MEFVWMFLTLFGTAMWWHVLIAALATYDDWRMMRRRAGGGGESWT